MVKFPLLHKMKDLCEHNMNTIIWLDNPGEKHLPNFFI